MNVFFWHILELLFISLWILFSKCDQLVEHKLMVCCLKEMQGNIKQYREKGSLVFILHYTPPAGNIERSVLTLHTWKYCFEISMKHLKYLLQSSTEGRSSSWVHHTIGRCSQSNMAWRPWVFWDIPHVLGHSTCFYVCPQLRILYSDARAQVRQQCGKGT